MCFEVLKRLTSFEMIDLGLEQSQKFPRVRAIHLCMMKLKGNRKFISQPSLSVFSQMMNRLLIIPLFMPTAPSISVSEIAEVPITIQFSERS